MKTAVRRGSWIVTVPVAAIAVAYVTLFFLPGRRAIGELSDQLRQKQSYISQAIRLGPTLEAAKDELDETRAYCAAWQRRAPSQRQIASLYGQIHGLTGAAGAVATRFDPQPIVAYDRVWKIPIAMGCSGSSEQIQEFLRGLEILPMSIWITSLRLEKVIDSEKLVECEINLVVFADNPENSG